MVALTQILINGLVAGAIYALIASGFSLIYNILEKFFHLAHGAVYIAGAFIAFTLSGILGLNIILSLLISIICSMLLGLIIHKRIYTPLKKFKNNELALMLASYGVFMFIEALILLIFGAEVRTFKLGINQGYQFLGGYITGIQIIIILISILIFVCLFLFLKKTRTGKALRAISDNRTVASTIGIDPEKLTLIVFAIGSALAGLAGVLVGMEQVLAPNMGFMAILKGITSAIIGGVGSVGGSALGGVLLGLAENIGITFLPSAFKDAIAFVILILFLLFRPSGFFGARMREDK